LGMDKVSCARGDVIRPCKCARHLNRAVTRLHLVFSLRGVGHAHYIQHGRQKFGVNCRRETRMIIPECHPQHTVSPCVGRVSISI
jgi:hypothetical protein